MSLFLNCSEKLQITQDKIVRLILSRSPRYHIGRVEFNTLGFLNVYDQVKQLPLNKICHETSTVYLTSGFNL